jgi:hypothetical protein
VFFHATRGIAQVAMRRFALAVSGGVVLAAFVSTVAGCAAVFGPRTVDVSQAQLQQWVDRQFPLDSRLLELFDVKVEAPRISLRAEADRLATSVDVSISDRLLRRPHRGTLFLEHGVRFEPADNTVRLDRVRLERFELDGNPAAAPEPFDRLARQLAERVLNDRVLYTLRPKDVEAVEGRGYRPSAIRVTSSGLSITLLPLPAR